MRRSDKQGVSYSVVPFGAFRQLFLVALPEEPFTCVGDDTQGHGRKVPDWPRQIRNVLESCRDVLKREGFESDVVMSNFFLSDIGKKELVRQLVAECLPERLGSMTFVPQAPADGSALGIEIWALSANDSARVRVDRETPLPGRITIVQWDDMRWLFAGDMRPGSLPIGAYDRSFDVFKRIDGQLRPNRFSVDQLVRTWIYQGHLVLPETTFGGKPTQRYKELNRARTDFFDGVRFIERYLPAGFEGDVYPASTGIGADDVDVVIGALAISTERNDFLAVPLENPNQTSAFDYGAVYSPQSPKFARAMAVVPGDSCLTFVSGTASITESESRFAEDPEKQTELTLDNIAALIDGDNLARHGIHGFQSGLDRLECVRVYVKRPDEFETIRAVCRRRLGDTPVLYTIADVCRPELLVEIEGFAVAHRS